MIRNCSKPIVTLLAVTGLVLIGGCAALPPHFKNHICPPQTVAAAPSVAYAGGMQVMPNGQPMVQQPYVVQGMPTATTPDGQIAYPQMAGGMTDAAPGTLDAMIELGTKLEASEQENASLRASLTQLKEENGRFGEAATKATELASRVRDDNLKLDAELQKWRSELRQVESIVQDQKVRQETSLTEIESNLDALLSEYESDVLSRAARN